MVAVTVEVSIAQPVWQVGHAGAPVTVMVGVTGHLGLAHGTSSVVMTSSTQSGTGPQTGSRGQDSVFC